MDRRSIRDEVAQLVLTAVRAPGTSLPGGAGDAEIAELQEAVGLPLPHDLVEWLRVCKGDRIGPGGVFGVRQRGDTFVDMAFVLDLHPMWRAHGWLPVAGDGNGDYYVLITAGSLAGHVAFVDQSDDDRLEYVVATSIWAFVRFLLLADGRDRRWPFDREHVIALDPGMAHIPAELRPWGDA